MARRRCYTKPAKSQYVCPVCKKPLTIRRCMNAKYAMYGCMYVQCTKHLAPYEDWPKRFEWVTNWYFAGEVPSPPPLFPSALPLTVNVKAPIETQVAQHMNNNDTASVAPVRAVIDLTRPEEGTMDNPIVLM
ncbi:hypothetical protein C8T65DRAFT_699740 [Cerioporus squamosus]|nr:hypothetical protein C8T65DRAFT_699740 [Cerioporus squamosus]